MKNSMNINDYLLEGYVAKANSSGEAVCNYLEYIDSLINELEELYTFADRCENKLDSIFVCQHKLSIFKRKLNAELLADWYLNYTHDLEREVTQFKNGSVIENIENKNITRGKINR
jgi:hypothetical protein